MLRRIVVVVTVVAMSLTLMAGPVSAREEQPWEKLFGCEGLVPIACPGPLPW